MSYTKSDVSFANEILESYRNCLAITNYHVILLLVSMYKDNTINESILNPKSGYIQYQSCLYETLKNYLEINKVRNRLHLEIVEIYLYQELINISGGNQLEILESTFKIDKTYLVKNFKNIFEILIDYINPFIPEENEIDILSKELARVISYFAKPKEPLSVVELTNTGLIFSDLAENQSKYSSASYTEVSKAIGLLRRNALGIKDSQIIPIEQDYIWQNRDVHDFVYASFSTSILSQQSLDFFLYDNSIQYLLNRYEYFISQNGFLVCIVPKDFLYEGTRNQSIRQSIIDRKNKVIIIDVPNKIVNRQGTSYSIIIIGKGEVSDKLCMISMHNYLTQLSPELFAIDVDSLLEAVDQKNESVIKEISRERISQNDYVLSPAHYLDFVQEGTTIKEVANILSTPQKFEPKNGRVISLTNSVSYKTSVVKYDQIHSEGFVSMSSHKEVDRSCIILELDSLGIKAIEFIYEGNSIYVNKNSILLTLKYAALLTEYFVAFLNSYEFAQQVHALESKGFSVSLSPHYLLNIIIDIPSLEAQKSFVQGHNSAKRILIDVIEKKDNELTAVKQKSYDEFASLKHTLGRPRQNIVDWLSNISHHLVDNQQIYNRINQPFEEFYSISLKDAFRELTRDLQFITSLLEKGESGFFLEDYPKRFISISSFFTLLRELSTNGLNFRKEILLPKINIDDEIGIVGNPTLLMSLFQNIFTNANKHAFESFKESNVLLIDVNIDNSLIVSFKNNGKEFPKGLERAGFISKYTSADFTRGNGIGGYDIHRIAAYHNNVDWKLILNEDPVFPVQFRFTFPLTLNKI